MGCPDIYYLQALQYMAHCLNYSKDKNKAKELSASKNITLLEKEILDWKEKMNTRYFYFDAGRVFEKVLTEADENDGCDGLNACLGGLNRFQRFIGLKYK